MTEPVVIAIDGPSGAGKGAVTQHLAQRTGFQVLDSGALYRLTGFAARLDGLELSDAPSVAAVARGLNVRFVPDSVWPRAVRGDAPRSGCDRLDSNGSSGC